MRFCRVSIINIDRVVLYDTHVVQIVVVFGVVAVKVLVLLRALAPPPFFWLLAYFSKEEQD